MHKKPKSKKQTYSNKQHTSPRLWPDFPEQLLSTIGKQSNLMKNINFGGVTKSWRAQTNHSNPTRKVTLSQLYENDNGNKYEMNSKPLNKFNISFRYGHLWWFSRTRPSQDPHLHFVTTIVGQSQGLTITKPVDIPYEYRLYDPVTWTTRFLPNWDSDIPFKHVALSLYPNNHSNKYAALVVTGIQHPALLFYEGYGGKYEWSREDSEIIDPYSSPNKQFMQFTSVIECKGKFYALSLQGTLAFIEVKDSKPRITRLGSNRAVPSVPSTHFKEYLIESEKQILLIFLVSRKSIHVVDDVEIYQLEFERLSWVKMTSLEDKTLFVGKSCCIFVNASKVGCRANSIYFTHQSNDDWWVYDMELNSILPGWEPAHSFKKSPVWDEPIADE